MAGRTEELNFYLIYLVTNLNLNDYHTSAGDILSTGRRVQVG